MVVRFQRGLLYILNIRRDTFVFDIWRSFVFLIFDVWWKVMFNRAYLRFWYLLWTYVVWCSVVDIFCDVYHFFDTRYEAQYIKCMTSVNKYQCCVNIFSDVFLIRDHFDLHITILIWYAIWNAIHKKQDRCVYEIKRRDRRVQIFVMRDHCVVSIYFLMFIWYVITVCTLPFWFDMWYETQYIKSTIVACTNIWDAWSSLRNFKIYRDVYHLIRDHGLYIYL